MIDRIAPVGTARIVLAGIAALSSWLLATLPAAAQYDKARIW